MRKYFSNARACSPVPLVAAGWVLGGCQRAHSALSPVSPEAGRIAHIWWVFFAACTAVYIIVMGFVLAGWIKSRSSGAFDPKLKIVTPESDRRTHRVIGFAAGATALVLVILLGADLLIQRSIAPRTDNPLTIRLTGHQWWWEAEYQNPNASDVFQTANELHVPVGRSIRLLLESNDVIHSFWVPQIHGKRDLVPGRPAEISFQVDHPGRYEGMCAEFCGYQHAHMVIAVIAEEPAQFEAWAHAERAEAPPSTTPSQQHGRELFEHASCSLCHTVAGTLAQARVGPVLTHLASRKTIGAGVLPNTRDALAAWITDPQMAKPGALMPPNQLSKDDLNALLDFMETLK